MRHAVKGKQLNRSVGHRTALFRNLMAALIEHGSIVTTEVKAKSIRASFDKLITKAKKGDVVSRRLIAKSLTKRSLVNKLVDEIAPGTGKRNSGYTRIIRQGLRRGDNTMMVKIELVDELMAKTVVEKKMLKKTKTDDVKKASLKQPGFVATQDAKLVKPKVVTVKRQPSMATKKV